MQILNFESIEIQNQPLNKLWWWLKLLIVMNQNCLYMDRQLLFLFRGRLTLVAFASYSFPKENWAVHVTLSILGAESRIQIKGKVLRSLLCEPVSVVLNPK